MTAEIYCIGIAGPSGAGKTFLAENLAIALGAEILALDRYYRDLSHLELEERARSNFDTPESVEHELLIEHIASLRKGETVPLPEYDFHTHTRKREASTFCPAQVVIVEGLFTLYWAGLRELLDMKVYVDAGDEVCLARRKERDVRERGRTPESVEEQYHATVIPMAQLYVRPAIAYADLVVRGEYSVQEGVARVVEHSRQQRPPSRG